jgi:hypothetical protein
MAALAVDHRGSVKALLKANANPSLKMGPSLISLEELQLPTRLARSVVRLANQYQSART